MKTGPAFIPPTVGPCQKKTYANPSIARKLARNVNDSGKQKVQPYHCARCHGWHLGTSDLHAQSRGARHLREELRIASVGEAE
jgi:hypothetical protein